MPADIMTCTYFWLGAIILFSVIEAATVGIVSIWFAIGSLFGLLAAVLKAPLWLQIAVFLVASALLLLFTRRLVKKHLLKNITHTNADGLIGQHAVVIEDINNLDGTGAAKVDGKVWTARSSDGELIAAGSTTEIIKIEGVKLLVRKADLKAANAAEREI